MTDQESLPPFPLRQVPDIGELYVAGFHAGVPDRLDAGFLAQHPQRPVAVFTEPDSADTGDGHGPHDDFPLEGLNL